MPNQCLETRSATVLMPGTCGELVQGAIGEITFLVSCPIDRYSRVEVTLINGDEEDRGSTDWPKARAAARLALDHFGCADLSALVDIASELPPGKGFGSSTADVAGAIFAVAVALGKPIEPLEVARLALLVEPSDGSIFPGLAVFDHRQGRRYEYLGAAPAVDVVVLDFGGEVDTICFNQRDWSAILRENEPVVAEALGLVRRGIQEGRLDLIGRAATMSAVANQRLLCKPELAQVEDLARNTGSLGVCVGHSGTIIGILVDPVTALATDISCLARRELPCVRAVSVSRLVGGGVRLPASYPRQQASGANLRLASNL